jgi:hypothetical protein
MNNDTEYTNGCSEEFAELCALSTSGELSARELAVLDEHIAGCASCASLLKEYTSLATVGMAKLAADRDQEIEVPIGYNSARAEERFIAAFTATQLTWRSKVRSRGGLFAVSDYWKRMKKPALWTGVAAGLLICIGGSFELGRKTTATPLPTHVAAIAVPAAPDAEKVRRKTDLLAAQTSLKAISTKYDEAERQVDGLLDTRRSLLAQIDTLTQKDGSDSASLASVTQQRDGLQRQLNDTTAALTRAKDDLTQAQQDRRGALYRVATLETEVNDLHTELSHSSSSATSDERFLAADRDIRELMGARQLYIADVFDVQNDGERSKPFGRVFYTKGKSLIFYAFDLQKQPEYREAKTFQAWGKPDSASGKPISLGIFYEDSEQNRRWVVKSENSDVLAQINAVFVTVEPRGGSQKPTGKPFLEAYLHSLPPNHP